MSNGHLVDSLTLRHTYVHFSCNADAKKARKEKDGGQIGKAWGPGVSVMA